MNIKQHQEDVSRTLAEVPDSFRENLGQELHMVIGISTEAAELLDAYKKELAYKKPLDDVNCQEEIGDIMWYISNLCKLKGWDFEKICQTNIDKLKARYPEKFTSDDALNRDLDSERKILENGKS